jgi:glycosyltransferase involved in cell wall biosynthesis
MPVYHGSKFLDEAIESILNQTFTDFEFLIIDDESKDNSLDIIRSYDDERVRLVENKKNLGQASSLNKGIKLACGKYIARMDQDDISIPFRLQKQVEFMENNLQVGVCGTWLEYIGHKDGVLCLETEDDLIKIKLLTNQNLAHPTVMIRKSILDDYNLMYDGNYSPAEDYDLWDRMFEYCDFANLPEPLVKYRLHEDQGSELNAKRQFDNAHEIRRRMIQRMGLRMNPNDLNIHNKIFCGYKHFQITISEAFNYLSRLNKTNHRNNIYNQVAFDKFIELNWQKFINKFNLRIRYKIPRLILLPRTSFWNTRDRVSLIRSYIYQLRILRPLEKLRITRSK